ncbi:MAG: Trk system potassium transporter TrkA [Paludibacteraceae bacterium]|nr:Trk system potassium transporter TrkA [Paludibacteraceae bacterium]
MRILIVGAGDVGVHLSKLLARENINTTLMDEDANRLGNLSNNYDIMTQIGSPLSIHDLRNAGADEADLFIAVTPYESDNITSCILAHNLGARRTLARVDNYEYILPENKPFFQKVGIDHIIYPEVLAAKEISESLRNSWIRNRLSLCDGALELVVVKVRSNAEMVGKKFCTGYFNHGHYRVVAIKRHSHTIIPGGNDEIMPGDLICVVMTEGNMELLRQQAGKVSYEIHEVTVMGATKIAQKTIQNIQHGKLSIKLMDPDVERIERVAGKLDEKNLLLLKIDMRNTDAVRDEGIDRTDAFIAVSDSSEANILACLAAKRNGVRKTIAEVENNDYIRLAESLDIGAVVNKKMIAASYIYQLTLDASVLNVRNLTSCDAEVVEFAVPEGAKITKGLIRDLKLPVDVNIGGLVRDGVGQTVNGNTQICAGDKVIVFCPADAIRKLEKFFR